MEVLTEAFVFYPAERFDIVGKQLLKINKKMYIVDLGLRNHILPRKKYDPGFSLENMVCFELLIVLTADHLTVGNYNGIHVKNLSDRLLEADR